MAKEIVFSLRKKNRPTRMYKNSPKCFIKLSPYCTKFYEFYNKHRCLYNDKSKSFENNAEGKICVVITDKSTWIRHIHHRKMNLQGAFKIKYCLVLILLTVASSFANLPIVMLQSSYLRHHKCLHKIRKTCIDFYGYVYYNTCVAERIVNVYFEEEFFVKRIHVIVTSAREINFYFRASDSMAVGISIRLTPEFKEETRKQTKNERLQEKDLKEKKERIKIKEDRKKE
ncbi:Hypothetical predicted protein [Octopus vulgaris]|uniref:Uncharacterized protein n=1 Tax=Octopus vulgaris TaxID=6645 RepID=A0AA36BKL5_OCTVU|nr:Hypothetical predicted protein [Octopus vulgaris]